MNPSMKNQILKSSLVSILLLCSASGWSAETPSSDAVEKNVDSLAEYGKPKGLAGDFTFGPSMSLLAIPHPLEIGMEAKYRNVIGFSIDYGFIPTLHISSATAQINAISAALRWFPFHGAFFLGVRAGSQKISVSKSASISGVDANVQADVTSSFYTPHMGWRWVWSSGFFTGIDLGWQVASGADTQITTNVRSTAIFVTPEYATLESDAKKVGNDIGNKALPSLTMIHFGWLF